MAETRNDQNTSLFAGLLRVVWMILGHAAILILATIIIADSQGTFTWRDIAIACVAMVVIGARYLDISRYHGETADGAPATMTDFKRYAMKVAIGTPVVWGAAHVLPL
jgi:hypothetical protein